MNWLLEEANARIDQQTYENRRLNMATANPSVGELASGASGTASSGHHEVWEDNKEMACRS